MPGVRLIEVKARLGQGAHRLEGGPEPGEALVEAAREQGRSRPALRGGPRVNEREDPLRPRQVNASVLERPTGELAGLRQGCPGDKDPLEGPLGQLGVPREVQLEHVLRGE